MSKALAGHIPPGHPLSPRTALASLDPKIKALAQYTPDALWERDTASLPKALARYRRRARDFARTALAPLARQLDQGHDDALVRQVLSAAGRAGYLSDLLPSPWGSTDLRIAIKPIPLVHSIKQEELCTVCGGLGLLIGAHALGAVPILLSGSLSAMRRFVLPANKKNKRGEPTLFGFAITEPGGGSDVEDTAGAALYRPTTVAKEVEGGYLLNGRKVFISGGDVASAVSVFAALEGEGIESWTCFVAEKGMPGFRLGRNELKMGQRASAASELFFDDLLLPRSHLVGGLRKGWAINRAVLNFSRIPVGAMALGIARGAMESAIETVRSERLANRPLIDYQEVQLSVAQMMIDTSAMRAMIWQSADTWTPTQARAAMTKVFCSDMAVKVCETALELVANLSAAPAASVEKTYRDARLTQIYEGTNQINRLAIIEDQMENLVTNAAEGS